MGTPHLDRLLFIQGGLCFFCRQPLPRGEASIEHLVASANGGTNLEDNCVACCRTLNSLLGSKSIKDKIQIFLNQYGGFRCPKGKAADCACPVAPSSQSVPSAAPAITPQGIPVSQTPVKSQPKPAASPPPRDSQQERLSLVLADLKKRGNSRPRKEATLTSTIQSLIKQKTSQPISDANLKKLVAELQRRGQVTIEGGKVTYAL